MFHYLNKKNLYSAVLILSVFCLTALLLSNRQISAYGENAATSGNAFSNKNDNTAIATSGNAFSNENGNAAIAISNIDFLGDTFSFAGAVLTNDSLDIDIAVSPSLEITKCSYSLDSSGLDAKPITLQGSFATIHIDQEFCGTVSVYCEDAAGNIYSCESPDIWLDRTCPLITYEDSSSMFLQHSELSVRIEDALGGCGLNRVRYCINNGEFIDASLKDNILCIPLEQTGTLHLTVWASDFAGNIAQYSTDVTVVEAPVVSVTVPTDTYLMLYPASDETGINLISNRWLIQNNSEVPVYVTLSDFRLISDYDGTFENSFLNLNLATANSQTTFPLSFSGMKNIHIFRLDAQGSSADASAVLYYKGYITSDFYEYLNQNFSNASLKLVYKFDVDMEYLFTKYSEKNSAGIEQ